MLIANKIRHCYFTYLHLRSICGTGNSLQQTSLQCLSWSYNYSSMVFVNNPHGIQ